MAAEDRLISRILGVTLRLDGGDGAARQQPVFLADLSQELVDEGAGDLLLRKEHMDRALMARLMLPPSPERQWPVHCLLDVYARAAEELRAHYRDAAAAARMQDVATFAQELAVSHMHLALVINMFPQAPAAEARGPLQLLDAMEVASGSGGVTVPPGTAALPSGFLERLAERYLDDGLAEIVRPIALQLGRQLLRTSLLGEVARPLGHLLRLASIPQVALALTRLPEWAPPLANGRELQTRTLLGPAFAVTAIPDIDIFFGHPSPLPPPQPDVAGTLFGHADASPTELAANLQVVRVAARGVRDTLTNLCMAFLRPQATREAMLRWIGLALEANREHDKEMPDVTVAAPRGLMLNLAAVLLAACKPFLDPASGKAWPRLDARYVRQGVRLDPSHDTRLHMTAEEAAADLERQRSHAAASPSNAAPWQPHFICECYFLTARCLHLGFVKAFGFTQQLGMSVQDAQEQLDQLDHLLQLPQTAADPMRAAMAQRQHDLTQAQLTRVRGQMYCIQAEALEPEAADSALAFCRLTAVWLLREASPAYKAGRALALPLAGPASDDFRALPEYLISDAVELLKLAPYFPEVHSALEALPLEELVLFLTAFMPAAAHVNNIYLRAQLGEVLASLMPREEEEDSAFPSRRRRPPRGDRLSQTVSLLLDTSPTVQQSLVANLLRLFVEIERTGRANQFYEKFNVRRDIGRILLLLWKRPPHRAAWLRTAEGEPDLYSRFNYFLETDATLHLDDALKLLQEERDFQQLPEAEQARGQGSRSRRVRSLNFHLHYATLMLLLLRLTTREVWAPWLQPAAAKRLAGTLDYFLKHLTGPERRQLRVKDPGNELRFDPKELLTQIASIYANLAGRDGAGVLAEAIAADKRSFYPQMFPEAIQVLRTFSLLPEAELGVLAALHEATSAAVGRLAAEDAVEAEAPEEFFDPIMSELMADPVTLPSGVNVERAIIERHMMSDPTDPFSRMPLKPEDLKPNPELRARIEAWRAEHGQR